MAYQDDKPIRSLEAVRWSQDDEVLNFISHCLRLKEEYNIDAERQAQFNSAWYAGRQLQFWNKERRRMETQANPNGRVRLTVNLIGGLVDSYIAKFSLTPINLEAEAPTEDLLDYERARIRSKALEHYGRVLSMPSIVQESDLAAVLHAETFLKVVWNPVAGDELGPIAATELDGEMGTNGRKLRIGDIHVGHIPIFNVFWGPVGVPFQEADWVVEVYERSKSYTMDRYKLTRDDVATGGDADVRIIRPNETRFTTESRERGEDIILVKTLWCRKNEAVGGLEQGRYCVFVGNKSVRNGKNPYQHGAIPIIRWCHTQVTGDPRGITPVTDLLPVQADLNRAVSQFCENRELMANPSWVYPEHSIVDGNEWTTQAGGGHAYRGAIAPKIELGAVMPAVVMDMMGQSWQWMQEIIGLREVSLGQNPAGVRAARSISQLKESDEERMAGVQLRRIEAWRKVGWLMLSTMRQYITEDRLVRIMGEDSAVATMTFTGKDFGKSLNVYDIKVGTSGLPRSRSTRLGDMDTAMERGFLNPQDPNDKAYVLGLVEGDTRKPLDPKKDAREVQHIRNYNMTHGEYLSPALYEDLETMVDVLRQFRTKTFFRSLDEDKQGLFERYEQECVKLMALRTVRLRALAQEALQSVGVEPTPPAQPTAPPISPPATENVTP